MNLATHTPSLKTCEPVTVRTLGIYRIAAAVALGAWGAAVCWRAGRASESNRIRLDERMHERNRIARELHDSLLQTIQLSKMLADDAQENLTDQDRVRTALQKISAWLERANSEGRAVLDSLRVPCIAAGDLAAALERALAECSRKTGIHTSVSVKGTPVELSPMIRDELFRVGYEAIWNACMHASANSIMVEIEYGRQLLLWVTDDGIGMDPAFLKDGKRGHYGIVGMRERARRIGAELSITSGGTGTKVKLSVSLRRARRMH
jgi:signal transduction histidine kinase